MVICHPRRWIYLDVPRTGSTSLCELLCRPEVGGRQRGERHFFQVPHGCEEYFTFATVRHPYPRVVSLWLHFLRYYRNQVDPTASATGNWPLGRFVEEVLIEKRIGPAFYQKTCHEWVDTVSRVDTILKTEELESAVARLGLVPGPIALPRLNGFDHASWETFYDAERRALVRYWAAEDFERYGYD